MSSFFAISAALAFLLTPCTAPGAEINHSWDALIGVVKTGSKIVVTRVNSAILEGKLASIDDQSITVQQRGGKQSIARTDVYRIRYARTGHPVIYGTLIGAAVGALSLWAVDHRSPHPTADEAVGFGIILGAPAGAIVGAKLPHSAPIYQAAGPNDKRTPKPK
jgi:hypothetical protein